MNKNLGKRLLAEGGVVIAIVIAFVFFSIMAPRAFLSFDNVINSLKSGGGLKLYLYRLV